MDNKIYNRMMWGCSCGHVARSALGEARHRHNFPYLCKRPKAKPLTQGKRSGKIVCKETPDGTDDS